MKIPAPDSADIRVFFFNAKTVKSPYNIRVIIESDSKIALFDNAFAR